MLSRSVFCSGPVAQPGRVPDFYLLIERNPAVSGSNPDGPALIFIQISQCLKLRATERCPPTRRVQPTSRTGRAHRHRPVVDEWGTSAPYPCRSRTGQRPAAAYSESSPIGAVHCVIGISSSARDQPGRGAPLPQLPGQVVGVLDSAVFCRRAHRRSAG
jgi:hypothetical protein